MISRRSVFHPTRILFAVLAAVLFVATTTADAPHGARRLADELYRVGV